MKIAFLGRVTLSCLAERFKFDRQLPSVRWDFNYGSDLVAALVDSGHEVSVVVTDMNHSAATTYTAGRLEIRIVPERRCRYQYMTFYSKEVSCMVDEIHKAKPDVILANWTYQYARAALKSGVPTLVVAHDSPWRVVWTMRNAASLFKAIYSQFFVFPHVKHMATVSPHMAEDLRNFNFYRKPVEIIPNAIKEETAQAGRIEIRLEARTILCVTQWGRLKNSKTLFKAFALLHARHPEWRLVVYGHYMDQRGADPWMRQNGMGRLIDSGCIELRGYGSSEMIRRALQKEADVFCSPSLEESFGMVFIEAMAHGVPCVGGEKSGAVPWVLGIDGFNHVENVERVENPSCSPCSTRLNEKERSESSVAGGVVCNVTRPEKLAECIENLMLDYSARAKMSGNAVRNVKERFMMTAVVKRYIAALENVVKQERGK